MTEYIKKDCALKQDAYKVDLVNFEITKVKVSYFTDNFVKIYNMRKMRYSDHASYFVTKEEAIEFYRQEIRKKINYLENQMGKY